MKEAREGQGPAKHICTCNQNIQINLYSFFVPTNLPLSVHLRQVGTPVMRNFKERKGGGVSECTTGDLPCQEIGGMGLMNKMK